MKEALKQGQIEKKKSSVKIVSQKSSIENAVRKKEDLEEILTETS